MNRLTAAFVRNKRKQSNIGTLNVLFGWITDRVASDGFNTKCV